MVGPDWKNLAESTINRWLLVLIGLCVIGYLGAVHFFSVPRACGCRATTLPAILSDALILENSVGDSNAITIRTRGTRGVGLDGHLQICYSRQPRKGNIDTFAGLPSEGCEYENLYDLTPISSRNTDVEASIVYEITDRFISIPPSYENKEHVKGKSTKGELYLNRSTNACTFRLAEWGSTKLSGRLECVDPVFYFNPWSWFPQASELFYTRAFFAIHDRPAKVD